MKQSASDEFRLHLSTPLSLGLRELLQRLERHLSLEAPMSVYLAGGMAVHLYTAERVTTDVDAEFSGRILVPRDLIVEVSLEDGDRQALYFDTNFNPMFALMHENYQEDAIEHRATQALVGFIGGQSAVRHNLNRALAIARRVEATANGL